MKFFEIFLDKPWRTIVLYIRPLQTGEVLRKEGGPLSGSQERIQEIYNRNSDMVYRICYLYLKNEQDAYDVTHETFIRLILREPRRSAAPGEVWKIRGIY